jgi:hypothetical protein
MTQMLFVLMFVQGRGAEADNRHESGELPLFARQVTIWASWSRAESPTTRVPCVGAGSTADQVGAATGFWVARRLLAWRTNHMAAYLASAENG